MEMIDELDAMRKKSKNLYGPYSGCMKRNYVEIKGIIRLLTYKAEQQGDTTFLKAQNRKLKNENTELKLKIKTNKEELTCQKRSR